MEGRRGDERVDEDERIAGVAIGGESGDGDDVADAGDVTEGPAVGGGVAAHGVDGPLRRHHEELVAAHGETAEHGVALRHDGLPPGGLGRDERRPHDPAARCPERRDAHQRGAVDGERERGGGLLTGDGRRPRPGGAVGTGGRRPATSRP